MLLIALGAAYACYQTSNEEKNVKIDPSVNLKGKTCIKLHEMEREMVVLELPIATISFFQCDGGGYQEAVAHLQQRCEEIIQANPFLAGRLLPMPDVQIVYDKAAVDRPSGLMRVFEPGEIPLKYNTPYEMYTEMLKEAVVRPNRELLGQNLPLFNISIIPDAGEWETKFAVVVSMSHALGDAHTYYQIYNMLSRNTKVQVLNPMRPMNYKKAIDAAFGRQEQFLNHLKESKRASEMAKREEPPFPKDEELNDNDSGRNPLLESFKQHQLLGQHSSLTKTVMKIFSIDQEWVLRQKGRRGSVFEADTYGQQQQHATTTATVVSANSIISSWFFQINQAAAGMLMVNIRGRLPECCISDLDAGNYAYPLLCKTFSTPGEIQNAVPESFSGNGTEKSSDVVVFDGNGGTSLCVNWANFFRRELCLDDESTYQTLHLPLYDTTLLKVLPAQVSCINIFNATCGAERRAGAFVVCQDDVWEEIAQSGIVGDMISEA